MTRTRPGRFEPMTKHDGRKRIFENESNKVTSCRQYSETMTDTLLIARTYIMFVGLYFVYVVRISIGCAVSANRQHYLCSAGPGA
jgi:hypothetical protein